MKYSKKRVINKAIPDNDPNGLLDIINVHRDLTVKGVELEVNIDHPYNGDLSIELHAPNGKKVTALAPGRSPGKDVRTTFSKDDLHKLTGDKSKGEWKMKVVDSGARDSGTLENWSLHLTLANSKKSEIMIEDDVQLKSVQYCHQGGDILDIKANLKIAHGHIGDLIVDLESPSGTTIKLHNKTGGAETELNKTFDASDLEAFIGEKAKGKWCVSINDTMPRDAGKLLSWSLNIKTGKKPALKEDLTKIEGIGPKIMELLYGGGIFSFEQLAASTPVSIQVILDKAGPRYQMHDPGSWPRQAKLAAAGNWTELEKLQDELDGGR